MGRWGWPLVALCIAGMIGGYFWLYVRAPMVDLPSSGLPVRVRFFEQSWAGSVWQPAARLEATVLGREVEIIAGSPFENSSPN